MRLIFWYAEDGQNDILISGPQYVEEGHDAILPAAPEVEGYVFVGWNPSPQNILADPIYMPSILRRLI